MMFYNNKLYDKVSIDLKKSIVLIILLLFTSFLVLGITIFCVNDKNVILLMIISTVLMTLAGWISLMIYFNVISKKRIYLRFLNKIINSTEEIVKGEIKNIEYNITSSDGIICNEIYINGDNAAEFIIKVDASLNDYKLSIGDNIVAYCRQNYLCGYEVLNYEK